MAKYSTKEDFFFKEISGITNSVADTEQLFKHNGQQMPKMWWPKFGSVYVPVGGWDAEIIDIRSSKVNEDFTIIVVF